ncbi:TPA: IS6 family transposase, partial [Streptococcus pyogenes]|nr:IS6 family transposase [Streptococcus pyogenes]
MEQDHRFIRKRVHSMSRFKSYGTAISVLSDVEVIYMMEKGEFHPQVKSSQT